MERLFGKLQLDPTLWRGWFCCWRSQQVCRGNLCTGWCQALLKKFEDEGFQGFDVSLGDGWLCLIFFLEISMQYSRHSLAKSPPKSFPWPAHYFWGKNRLEAQILGVLFLLLFATILLRDSAQAFEVFELIPTSHKELLKLSTAKNENRAPEWSLESCWMSAKSIDQISLSRTLTSFSLGKRFRVNRILCKSHSISSTNQHAWWSISLIWLENSYYPKQFLVSGAGERHEFCWSHQVRWDHHRQIKLDYLNTSSRESCDCNLLCLSYRNIWSETIHINDTTPMYSVLTLCPTAFDMIHNSTLLMQSCHESRELANRSQGSCQTSFLSWVPLPRLIDYES